MSLKALAQALEAVLWDEIVAVESHAAEFAPWLATHGGSRAYHTKTGKPLAPLADEVNPKTGLTFVEEQRLRDEWYRDADKHDHKTGEFVQMQPNDVSPEMQLHFRAIKNLPKEARLAYVRQFIHAPHQAPPGFYESLEWKLLLNDVRQANGYEPEPLDAPPSTEKPQGVPVEHVLEVVTLEKAD